MILELLFTLMAISIIYLIQKRRVLQKHAKDIPGNDGLPILGNICELISSKNLTDINNRLCALTEKYNDYGIMKFWFGHVLILFICDPQMIEIIAESPHSANKGELYHVFVSCISNGVITMDGGPAHQEIRKPVIKSMTKKLLNTFYFDVFVRTSKELTEYIKQNREGIYYDVSLDIGAATFSALSETHFGIKVNEIQEKKWNFTHNVHNGLRMLINRTINYPIYAWSFAAELLGHSAANLEIINKLNNCLKWVIEERRKCMKAKKEPLDGIEYYPDFLLRRGLLKNINETELLKQLFDFTTAGSETSSTTLSSALVFLAMFPEIQEKVHEEQDDIFGESDRDPIPEDLASMKYLRRVIKETLRHVSPPGLFKYCQNNVNIGKYTAPKGSFIFVNAQTVHKDPKYWERPNTFYPDHFLPEVEAARHRYAYTPFGVGPRTCTGFQYGMDMIMLIISRLMRSYRVTTNMKFEDIDYEFYVMRSMGRYNVKFDRK